MDKPDKATVAKAIEQVLAPCLHCEIVDLASRHMREHHLFVNEIAFKQVEALAELIAGIGDRKMRRQIMDEIAKDLRRGVARKVAERREDGTPSFDVVRSH